MSNQQQAKGFLELLFDFSFTTFFTPRIIKVLYGLSIAWLVLAMLFLIIAGFVLHPAIGVLVLLIVAPLFFLVSLIYERVVLELIVVCFRVSERMDEIAAQGRRVPAPPVSNDAA